MATDLKYTTVKDSMYMLSLSLLKQRLDVEFKLFMDMIFSQGAGR